MSNSTNKPSISFWIIGVLALIWNGLGIHGYIQQAYNTEGFQSQYPEEHLEIMANQPAWLTAAFAIAVFSSTIGCLLLLMKKKRANLLLKIGLLAVIPQTIYKSFISEGIPYYSSFEYSMLFMIPIIAIFLVWYSNNSIKNGWLS